MEYSGAGGQPIYEKNQKQKISWHCPFKVVSLFLTSPPLYLSQNIFYLILSLSSLCAADKAFLCKLTGESLGEKPQKTIWNKQNTSAPPQKYLLCVPGLKISTRPLLKCEPNMDALSSLPR